MAQHPFPTRLIATFEEKGFTKVMSRGEITYQRNHQLDSRMKVVVYTGMRSVADWQSTAKIHVCTLFVTPNKTYPIGKFPPVASSGNVDEALSRILETARKAYSRGTEWIESNARKNKDRNQEKRSGGYVKIDVPKTPLDGF